MTDLLVRDAHRHMRQSTARPKRSDPYYDDVPLCGGSGSSYNLVDHWPLVTCQLCCLNRLRDRLRDAGYTTLQVYEAAAERLLGRDGA